nr:endochitinase At2g43590-like [Aedes albopictus]
MVTTGQLNSVLSACGYGTVGSSVANVIVNQINNMTGSINEAAMFLAQLIHESGGFQHRREINGAALSYAPYYGRGYIQLTHDYNYRAASMALFGDERLINNPDMVSDSAEMSMRVSVWFWEARVRPEGGPSSNNFGLTTKAINGGLEPPGSDLARRRYNLYVRVANALGVSNIAPY